MGPNARVYLLCDECDYKGTVRAPDGRGLTRRRPCLTCRAQKYIPTRITAGMVDATVLERDRLRARVAELELAVAALTVPPEPAPAGAEAGDA